MKVELLSPAGSFEKLKTAYYFGADACYFAGKRFGLRAFASNFDDSELKGSIEFAHKNGKKAYITINILAHNPDFDGLKDYVCYLEKIGADAVIVSDLGVMKVVKENTKLPIHISTQANITNKYAAKVFADYGASRLILARELSIQEIKEIREYLPKSVELEVFVHGAMCMAYSGRCLLSNYLCGRDSNKGECAQVCRFEYSLIEKTRPKEEFDIEEDSRGTYILNSKDLNMVSHLKDLYDAGVTSFKIEGRMKSPYYVATVTNAYRRAINYINENENEMQVAMPEVLDGKKDKFLESLEEELEKTSHRRYTTGFYYGNEDRCYTMSSMPIQSYEFMAVVKGVLKNGLVKIEQRNRFKKGDILEVLSPSESFNKQIKVEILKDKEGNEVKDAKAVQQILYLKTDVKLAPDDILRKKI